jgi:hypothetical protein
VEEKKRYEEERSDLAQPTKPWACSYFPSGGQGAVSQERTTKQPQLGLFLHRGADI